MPQYYSIYLYLNELTKENREVAMFKDIIKRDQSREPFTTQKIEKAILKAGTITAEFGADIAHKLMLRVINLAQQTLMVLSPTVEEIQDIVEDVLLASPYKKTAKAYILYRDQHAKIREIASKANVTMIDQYLQKLDWQIKENSNMGYSLQGLNNYISSEISKTYWLNKIYPPEIKQAHIEGDFHIHDLGLISVYCVGWDLMDLLTKGFKGAEGKIESKPAKHFRSALGQVVNFFYTLQGEAAGAQAFSNFDTLLAPFIRYDSLTYNEVFQCLQEFIFNINVPTRVGFQTPFTNITLDLQPPTFYAKQNVIVGGEPQKEMYCDFQYEMDMLNRAFLEVMCMGDAQGRVFTFPVPTYNITKDFDWNHENLKYLWTATAKYGIPYFSNFVNSDLNPEDARSMCCRLRLDTRTLMARGGGLFGANPLTGSIGVVTINLPRLGYLCNTKEEFYTHLDDLMIKAKQSLELKRKILESLTDNDLYPYTKFYLADIKAHHGLFWRNHFSTIGIVGMNEACLNLLNQDISTTTGQSFAIEVLNYMREKLIQFQEETGNNYNLEATPAEGTSYRLARIDKSKYPNLIVANENAYQNGSEPFYTNSSQLPVNYSDDIFEVLQLQDPIQTLYTGGTVLHIFGGEQISNIENVKVLVQKICSHFHLPYFTYTPTFSICQNHGYISGEHTTCPICDTECEVYSRVTGYLRPIKQWNEGKREEFKMRKVFKVEG